MPNVLDFDISLEVLLEIPYGFKFCPKLSILLTLMHFSLTDNLFVSIDSQEDFPFPLARMRCEAKAVKHTRVEKARMELPLSHYSLFSLLTLPELDLSCKMEGKHSLDPVSSFVTLYWSLYCWGFVSKLHTVLTVDMALMQSCLIFVG